MIPDDDTIHETDLGNSRRLRLKHGADIHYCHPWRKWLRWDGRRWEEDATAHVLRLGRDVVSDMLHEAADLPGEERKALIKWGLKSESEQRLEAMVGLCESEPGIPVVPDELDRGAWLLNTPSGTVDLRAAELRPHRREDLITKLTGAPFDPDAGCPRFEEFLLEIMGEKEELVEFLGRAAGYVACGEPRERKLFVLWGSGRNGKSTFLNVLFECLGDYAKKIAVSSLLMKKGDSIPNDIAALKGSRLVFAAESAEGKKLDEALVKEITGREPVSARFMRAEWFSFLPQFVPILATNHKPIITGTDPAIWDRVCLIPFTVRFEGKAEKKNLLQELRMELPGILGWIVRGALEWQRDGLQEPEEVRAATAEYRSESDPLGEFLAEECLENRSLSASSASLYKRYHEWAKAHGEDAIPSRNFYERLRERGLTPVRICGKRSWKGIGLRSLTHVTAESAVSA